MPAVTISLVWSGARVRLTPFVFLLMSAMRD